MSYIETYYRRALGPDAVQRPALEGRVKADVCVVGGGLAGLTVALELVRKGRKVCLLEANRVAWGASGRNGGFVSPGWAARYKNIQRMVGADHAKELHRLSIEGMEDVLKNVHAFAIQDAKPTHGILGAVRYEATDDLKAHRDWLEKEFDYKIEFKSRNELKQLLVSPRYYQALFDPNAFHFNPLTYAQAIAAEIERLGGKIYEGSAAVAVALNGATKIAKTAHGSVDANDLVIASGGYTGNLIPQLKHSYLPIATYVMLTKPNRGLIASAILTDAAIGDDRRAGDYYRVVDGGERVLWGGKITTRTTEPRLLGHLLHKTMVSTYPQLRDLDVEIVWSGLMSYARHMMPQIGRLQPGVWYCTAFGGHGMNTTAIGGRVIAEAILGETDRYKLFAPFGLAWNGWIAGRVAAQLTYWAYQAADLFRERKSA
ncbi:FAD-dependent oxidoreductase [Microvirga sp. KLBC 81]|uniref:NAD(P)/FAD-dependent oxidoreductase n=1 Tax=Microvirga sp. KLBC 81 TaxID=1862707 RepID=UPI000D525130|nr:FAD-binding oxidoreductase [Microvirga sp. KLBC 81]PVE22062.1 FAD-dependent oxidoreductase [Microvirga sp. KLBC 81]